MARVNVLFTIATVVMVLAVGEDAGVEGTSGVGINWGRQTSQKLLPSMVADMCLANGIKKVKFFSVNDGVLSSFVGTNIELIVGLSTVEFNMIKNYESGRDWIKQKVAYYVSMGGGNNSTSGLNISYLCIGSEPFSKIERIGDDTSFTEKVVPIMQYFQKAMDEEPALSGGRVKLLVPCATDVLNNASKPSDGDFKDDVKADMLDILDHLNRTNSAFMLNIYPYFNVVNESLPFEFGLFDKKSNYVVQDGDLTYTNVFDAKYDTLVWALQRHGYGNLKILIGSVGWPTDGGPQANADNAKRFYDGLFKKLANDEGTPLLPGKSIEVYAYALTDENQKRIDRGPFERHYGIYKYDGKPKFNIDFTLQGREIELEHARGVTYLPQRWCQLRDGLSLNHDGILAKVNQTYETACRIGDCTRLAEGASCNKLDYRSRVSFAYNMFFQMSNQEVLLDACNFDDLGEVTDKEPRYGTCEFPVQILSTLFLNGASNKEMQTTLGTSDGYGRRFELDSKATVLVLFLCVLLLQYLENPR